jgi:uracil phosphoribosyltransferase
MQNVYVLDHPVIQTKLAELRDVSTNHYTFRSLLEEIAMLMTYEVSRDWPTVQKQVRTPMESTSGRVLSRQVTLVPVLRAGLGMTDGMLRVLPEARVGHLGVRRNEDTLEPIEYYKKLPPDIAETEVLLVDPMLATGGSAAGAVSVLKSAGVKTLKFVCLVAAPEGVAVLNRAHADVPIYCCAVDRKLNDKGYILPGLGDAGDRIFGT